MLKIFSKMGIATVDGYRGAQIHEAIGLGAEVVDLCLRGTTSTVGGVGFAALGADVLERHAPASPRTKPSLDEPGYIRFRKRGGEYHANNPDVISRAARVDRAQGRQPGRGRRRRRRRQPTPPVTATARAQAPRARVATHAGRGGRQVRRRPVRAARGPGQGHLPRAGYARRQRPAAAARPAAAGRAGRRARRAPAQPGRQRRPRRPLRPLPRPRRRRGRRPSCTTCSRSCPRARRCPIDEVEPVEEITRRFSTGAMSHGSLSAEAHETLADRDEHDRRQEQLRRGRRGPGALPHPRHGPRPQLAHQADRVRPLRGHPRVLRVRGRAQHQDGAGLEAR